MKHYEEDQRKYMLRNAAIDALHMGMIDGQFPERSELIEELQKIRKWWSRACDAVNYERQDPVLMDEAPYAVEWCIRLAEQFVETERAFRSGVKPSWLLESTKEWVWDRFKNLEAGLMSNGIERPS